MMETKTHLLEKKDMTDSQVVPEWVTAEYKTFHDIVTNPTFPCYFGMKAEKKDELRYAYITHNDWSSLPKAVESFLELFKEPPHIRHGLFVFVEPEKEEKDIPYYRDYFWRILQYLHEQDPKIWPDDKP